jgi:hypothetical protein
MAAHARIFSHNRDNEGSFNSVCPDCFKTIATQRLELDLLHYEFDHVCNPDLLRALWGVKFLDKLKT